MSAEPVAALHGTPSVRHSHSYAGQEYRLLVIEDAPGPHRLSAILRRTFPQSTVISCASVGDVIRELTRSGSQTPCVVMATDDLPRLSSREEQVLGLVAKGLQIADVARALEISANTVCSHLKNIYRKRKVCSRAEAALEAQRLGLV